MAGSGEFVTISVTLNYTSRSEMQTGQKVGICLATVMYDTVSTCVTDNCPIGASQGRANGNVPWSGLISQLTWHIAMYILTDEVITQHDTLFL